MFNTNILIQNIKNLCDSRSMTVASVLRQSGLNTSAVNDWAKGKSRPSLVSICKLCDFFDITLDSLVYGNETTKSKTTNIYSEISYSNLLDDEKEMLDKYHDLNSKGKLVLLGYADGLKSAYPKTQEQRLSV